LIFPGGDIGKLAVYGTVNDLSMSGARPMYLSAGFIIEEGLHTETLWAMAQSMRQAAEDSGVTLVTGDTKVVDRGKGDGLFINTAGIGIVEHELTIAPSSVKLGDTILISGDIGRHGIAIMSAREGLSFESAIESDCAPLWKPIEMMLKAGINIHCLRDLTRGGLGSALVEIAEAAGVHINIDERAIPVREDVQGACEILGFDPIYVANEGRFVAFVPESDTENALEVLCSDPVAEQSRIIGRVGGGTPGFVTLKSKIGINRILDMLSGEQLPRIC
jgi:hydrogenase expression/formation protein HypE